MKQDLQKRLERLEQSLPNFPYDLSQLSDEELAALDAEYDAKTIREYGEVRGRQIIEETKARIRAMTDDELAAALAPYRLGARS